MPANRREAPSQSTRTASARRIGGYATASTSPASRPNGRFQIEDPPPRQRVGDIPADQRSGDGGDAEHTAEHRLDARAFRQRVQLADDRHAQRDDRACTESLDRARGDEHGHRGRGSGRGRPHQKNGDAEEIDAPAAVQVGQASPDRHRCGRRQEVRGKDPTVVREAAQGRDHRRHGGGDHRGFEYAQAHAEEKPRGDRAAPGQRDRRRGFAVVHPLRVPRGVGPQWSAV